MSRSPHLGIELIDEPGWMGGTLYLRNLVRLLARLPVDERPRLTLMGSASVIDGLARDFPEARDLCRRSRGRGLVARLRARLGFAAGGQGDAPDVVYPGFGVPPTGSCVVRWIPDFQHRYLPNLFSAEERERREQSIGRVAGSKGMVVLSSQAAARDFDRFFAGHTARARVWSFCSLIDADELQPATGSRPAALPQRYLYLPNQFWAHKNHLTVLRALRRLRDEAGVTVPLVCTGAPVDSRDSTHYQAVLAFIEESQLSSQVILLGLLPRREQLQVLRHATAVVQPSLFEGWSTVVEDARAVGRPIFLSDIAVHREQAPPRSWFFPPEEEQSLADLIGAHWPLLPAGPDFESESVALAAQRQRIDSAARVFVQIMEDAFLMHRECDGGSSAIRRGHA